MRFDDFKVWSAGTEGDDATQLVMQGDGNLVVEDGGTTLWRSNTDGHDGSTLVIDEYGRVAITNWIWQLRQWANAQGYSECKGRTLLPGERLYRNQFICAGGKDIGLDSEGRLVDVRYIWMVTAWAGSVMADLNGRFADILEMQSDGNLVAKTNDGEPLWSSRTDGNPGAELGVMCGSHATCSGGVIMIGDESWGVLYRECRHAVERRKRRI